MRHMDLVTWLILASATMRITRLVTEDTIFDTPRAWLQERAPDWLAYLIVCPWCVSVYAGAGVAGLWAALGGTMWLMVVYAALGFSYAAGWLATREGE